MNEQTLVKLARGGDRRAMRKLFETHKEPLYQLAHRMLNDGYEAEDVVIETFRKAFSSLASFDGRSSFSTWCYRIALNKCLDRLRLEKRRVRMEADDVMEVDPPSQSPHPREVYQQTEVQVHLERALARLQPANRAAVLLRDVQGCSYREIADSLSCATGTVASRIARGRSQIADYFKSIGITSDYFEEI